MNVALTYFCNQRCAYCFGADAMSISRHSAEAREMSLDSLRRVLEFMKESRVLRFNMIGGEPTQHSRFEEFFDIVSASGFPVMIFSNGVIDKQRVDFLERKSNLGNLLLNIREPQEYSANDWEKIEYTLYRLNNKVTLSFRIYRMDFDPRFLFDLVDGYSLNRMINWAIACPSLISDNAYVRLEDHEQAVERMVEFSFISRERDIKWYSDSGFILCAFTDGKLEALRKNVGFIPITNCYPAIEVAPDLRVFRCFGMAPKSRPQLKLTDFKNLAELRRYFIIKSLPFKRIGGMDRCFKCEYIIDQRCGGGCMAHILKRLAEYKQPIF